MYEPATVAHLHRYALCARCCLPDAHPDPFLLLVLGGGRRRDNGRVNDRSLFRDHLRFASAADLRKQLLLQSILYQQIPKASWYPRPEPDCLNRLHRNPKMPGCRLLLRPSLHRSGRTDFAAGTDAAWSPADRVCCRALLCNSTAGSGQAIPFHGTIRSICARNSFFFVRTCASSSLSADMLICFSILSLYHIEQYCVCFSVRYCPKFQRP